MEYQIQHTTTYQYSDIVTVCQNLAHLTPSTTAQQTCLESRLEIIPEPSVLHEFTDYFGNTIHYFEVAEPHDRLTVIAQSRVLRTSVEPPLYNLPWEEVRTILHHSTQPEIRRLRQFTLDSPMIQQMAALRDFVIPSFPAGRPILEAVMDLTERIFRLFRYQSHVTTITTPLAKVMEQRRGVCQDFAQVAIGALRSLGLAACYVSGYLETLPPLGRPRMVGSDASHAWFAVFIPDYGWVEFDPTNNLRPTDRHITIAIGRDYADVTPLKGIVLGGGKETLTVAVDVERRGYISN